MYVKHFLIPEKLHPIQVEISPEVPIFNWFLIFYDIPNEVCAVSKDKSFREKDNSLTERDLTISLSF